MAIEMMVITSRYFSKGLVNVISFVVIIANAFLLYVIVVHWFTGSLVHLYQAFNLSHLSTQIILEQPECIAHPAAFIHFVRIAYFMRKITENDQVLL